MNTQPQNSFSREERKVLHSLVEIFQDKECRDKLREIIRDGTTLRELIMAYKTQRRLVSYLKAVGGLVVLLAAVVAAVRQLGWMPPK